MPASLSCSRNLLVRAVSASLFVPAVLLMVQAGDWVLLLLVLLIVGRGSWEFYYMARQAGGHPSRHLGLLLSVALCLHVYLKGTQDLIPAVTAITLSVFVVALIRGTRGYTASALLTLGGVLYLGLLGSAPLLIVEAAGAEHQQEAGRLLAVLFICIWLTDAAAFLVGRRLGRHKLAPGISPAKTVEGCVAGLGAGLLPATLCCFLPSVGVPWLLGLLLVASLGGQIGDLVESAIKRDLGVKDAPSLIPGHGGVLDRFDSYLFAFPLAYLYLRMFGIL